VLLFLSLGVIRMRRRGTRAAEIKRIDEALATAVSASIKYTGGALRKAAAARALGNFAYTKSNLSVKPNLIVAHFDCSKLVVRHQIVLKPPPHARQTTQV
jgi:hypothetical protein